MRQRRLWAGLLIVMAAVLLSACTTLTGNLLNLNTVSGSGNVVTEDRNVSGFTGVSIEGLGDFQIDQSGSDSVSVTADDNFLPYIQTVVEGDTLHVRVRDDAVFTNISELDFAITAASLDALTIVGAARVDVSNLDSDSWNVSMPGAGSINVSGRSTEQSVSLTGAGSYDGAALASQVATVNSTGAGSVVVQVSDTLDVTITGLGTVEYIGNPTVTQEITGIGEVKQRQ